MTLVDADRQRDALDALLQTLDVKELELDPSLVLAISPRPPMSGDSRELFPRETGYVFDPVSAAATASDLTLRVLLDPARNARLNHQVGLGEGSLTFSDVVNALISTTFSINVGIDPDAILLRQRLQHQVVSHLQQLAKQQLAAPDVRAVAWNGLLDLESRIDKVLASVDPSEIAPVWRLHYQMLDKLLASAADNDQVGEQNSIPPGPPI